ncbi:MAG: hypothetical protein ABFE07_04965 [Armatimonadia bacterium]
MYWPTGINLLQSWLLFGVWVALPLLGAIAAGGLVANLLQGALVQPDGASLVPPRLLAAAVALLFFGAWMLTFMAQHWITLWLGAPQLVR